jgi:hypothetical protein
MSVYASGGGRQEADCARAASSGTPIATSWSNRPARRSAASSASGRFVAPMTMTGRFSFFSHASSAMCQQGALC